LNAPVKFCDILESEDHVGGAVKLCFAGPLNVARFCNLIWKFFQ